MKRGFLFCAKKTAPIWMTKHEAAVVHYSRQLKSLRDPIVANSVVSFLTPAEEALEWVCSNLP
jgi:hypothetical protein